MEWINTSFTFGVGSRNDNILHAGGVGVILADPSSVIVIHLVRIGDGYPDKIKSLAYQHYCVEIEIVNLQFTLR